MLRLRRNRLGLFRDESFDGLNFPLDRIGHDSGTR